ncbi:MAG: hypothetical protein GWN77_02215 [Gammaproteobacteria bacterium]|nr:hypothetical protein [Gammaproteobacteria bacterium]
MTAMTQEDFLQIIENQEVELAQKDEKIAKQSKQLATQREIIAGMIKQKDHEITLLRKQRNVAIEIGRQLYLRVAHEDDVDSWDGYLKKIMEVKP